MVFCPANGETVQHVRGILDTYKLASGQEINLCKSSATFSRNTPVVLQQQLADLLGIRLENKHELYLGLPAMAFRSKKALFAALKDRIWRRIHGWHERTLSQAGKAVLIQGVVQAIPAYAMSCFHLPRSLLQQFQSLAADFFWHDGERRRIHWLAWDKLSLSKVEGALAENFFNLALLAKQLWRLLSRPESLVSKVLKAKYFPRSHLFDATLGSRPSYTWRSMLAALPLLRSGCRWRVGTGSSVRVWQDPWLPRGTSFRVITPPPLGTPLRVRDLILQHSREWDVELIQSLFWPDDSNVILQIPLSCVGVPDLLIWHYSTTGLFTVRSAYHLALSLAVPVGASTERWSRRMWQKIWQAHVPNKAKIFMWRAIRNILPTSTNLQKRIPLGTFCCPFCEHEAEQPLHTLLHCTFARQVVDFARSYLAAFQSQGARNPSLGMPFHASWTLLQLSSLRVYFSLVRRAGNSAADFLAKHALNLTGDGSWLPHGFASVLGDVFDE
ncbi:UNVERIFIED_CONTAM: putative mitochondrial protein [Sesamum radiatum]|uniref:Mitochondrial protein n=1 Tax=Sesamum radiatum TaxID=300843 RepID=A0AAW2UAB8_SESRA